MWTRDIEMGYFKKFGQIDYGGVKAANILTAVLPSRLNIDKAGLSPRVRGNPRSH